MGTSEMVARHAVNDCSQDILETTLTFPKAAAPVCMCLVAERPTAEIRHGLLINRMQGTKSG